MDGSSDGLFSMKYIQKGESGPYLSLSDTGGGMTTSSAVFEVNQWYKFTITGSPNAGEDGDKCQQEYVIEGPGLRAWFWSSSPFVDKSGYVDDKWTTHPMVNDCLVLDDRHLKVYAARKYSSIGGPLDGVVRNVAFTNTKTQSTINTICT